MGSPLVSMMVVAHNTEHTLAVALASVVAQTHDDWECVVVDDGSQRAIGAIVEAFADSRFFLIQLKENRGRGYARSRALEAMRGRLCGILDADDWMYPTRLEKQIACFDSDPSLKLVGSSMLVEDASRSVLGVQEASSSGRFPLGIHPFSFAPILVDGDAARRIGFRVELTRSEDVPFLTLALEMPWTSIRDPLYVYRPSPPTRASVLESSRCSRHAYSLNRSSHPLAARRLEVAYGLRELVHRSLPERASRRLTAWARARVVRTATDAERNAYRVARATVLRVLESKSIPSPAAKSTGEFRV